MTLLVISPDYASHLLPLATLATAWRDARSTASSSPPARRRPQSWRRSASSACDLQLGRGSNPGVIRAEDQPDDEADSLRGFFDATRRGHGADAGYQARERLTDLHVGSGDGRPSDAARSSSDVRPDAILVDHLAFSARLGAVRRRRSASPTSCWGIRAPSRSADEVYGFPPAWPAAFRPDAAELGSCARSATRCRDDFTARVERAPRATLDAARAADADAFGEHGPRVLYNYPAAARATATTARCRRTPSSARRAARSPPMPRSTNG